MNGKCDRAACRLTATRHVRVTLWTGKVLDASLCDAHASRMHSGMLSKPQTASGSSTPLAGVVAGGAAVGSAA